MDCTGRETCLLGVYRVLFLGMRLSVNNYASVENPEKVIEFFQPLSQEKESQKLRIVGFSDSIL